MTDTNFPFRAAPPAGTEPPKEKRERKSPAAKPEPRKRSEVKKKRAPRPVSVPIGVLPSLAGMSETDASMLMSILGNLQGASKRSRVKIVAALSKVFK